MWGEAEPLEVQITAIYEPPKSTSKREKARMLSGELLPTKKPDADNIAKVVLDALNGVAYRDDSQIVRLMVKKEYGEESGLRVQISEVDTGK